MNNLILENWPPHYSHKYAGQRKLYVLDDLLGQHMILTIWYRLLIGWLCFTSHRQRGHLETAPPFTVPCKGRDIEKINYTQYAIFAELLVLTISSWSPCRWCGCTCWRCGRWSCKCAPRTRPRQRSPAAHPCPRSVHTNNNQHVTTNIRCVHTRF